MILKPLKTVLAALALALPCMAGAQTITEPSNYYLMHASGLHLAKSADGHASLEAATATDPMMLTFTPLEGGYYHISAPDGTFMQLQGGWSTFFLEDGTTNNSQYAIESAGTAYIRLKCRANGKYLGTDAITEGSNAFSDKSGADSKHFWYLATDPTQLPPVEEKTYVLNPAAERQLFDGWGVSLCWWANMCGKWDDDKIDEIIDWLVSPDGLNFRFFRYNIGGGDDPENAHCDPHHMGKGKGLRAEMEGFKDSSDGPYIWTRDAAQRKIMLKIKEKRPDAVFEAFSNSAPWYMTYSGCVSGHDNSGHDNLKPEYYEEFAHYLVDVCKHYKDEYDIEFHTLAPFNEPMTSYWGRNGGQEGCHFDVASQIAFLKVLHPILAASGLKTVISSADETSVAQQVTDLVEYRKAGVLDLVSQINTHTYTADDNARARLSALCREENKPLWMSEVGSGGTGFAGNLGLAQKLINDMRFIAPGAWIDWQYIEENNDQWCLVQAESFAEGTYHRVPNYYVRSHFSRYIKPGYTILATLNGKTLAARSADGSEVVLVAINDGASDVDHIVDMSMYDAVAAPAEAVFTDATQMMQPFTGASVENKTLRFRIPAQTIVTLVIPVTAPANTGAGELRADVNYVICPRNAAANVLEADGESVSIMDLDFDAAQIWHLAPVGTGYRLVNANGDIITVDGENYPLISSKEEGAGQVFSIESIDGTYYRIMAEDGVKGFDLNGEKSVSGTQVGVWDYAADAPVHRQWAFLVVPQTLEPAGIENIVSGSDADTAVIRATEGAIEIEGAAEGTTLRIFNASGVCLYANTLTTADASIPMPAGIYIVSLGTATRTVMVK